jgi:fatty-acid desaturase
VLCGVLSLQGGPLDWVATHRAHHAYADADGDPHDAGRGMWWAHAGWILGANTWLVNSASHGIGYRTFRTADRSTNNWWVALLSFGEGWHNNHHAFPYSARHGLRWFEADVTFYAIELLAALRLATNVKLPQPDAMKRMLRHGPQAEVTLAA